MTEKCFYCDKEVTDSQITCGTATEILHGLYAHYDCIDSRGDGSIMTDQTQHILVAADSAHQGIELAKSLLQESLGNVGEILTQGCARLGEASLGSTMRLGQSLKRANFFLDDLLKDAHGLCVLLGHDLGVCEDDPEPWADLDEGSHEGRGALPIKPSYADDDSGERGKRAAALWYKSSRALGDDLESGEEEHNPEVCEDEPEVLSDPCENPGAFVHGLFRGPPCDDTGFPPGEDEYDDDEQPF